MGIIARLLSALRGDADRGTEVAVEREPAAADERAVKGLDDEADRRQDAEGGAEPEAPAADAGESVEAVKGIGPAYAERLADAGVTTVADLAAAEPDELAEATGLGSGRIEDWIDRARARRR